MPTARPLTLRHAAGDRPGEADTLSSLGASTKLTARSRRPWTTTPGNLPAPHPRRPCRRSSGSLQHRAYLRGSRRESKSAGLLWPGSPPSPHPRRPRRRIGRFKWHRSRLLFSRRESESPGLLQPGPSASPRPRRPHRRGHCSEQYRECVQLSQPGVKGAGVLPAGAPALPRRRRPDAEIHYAGQSGLDIRIPGRETEGARSLRPSAPRAPCLNDRAGEANTLSKTAGFYSALGEGQKALEFFNQALRFFHALEDRKLKPLLSSASAVGPRRSLARSKVHSNPTFKRSR